MAGRNVSTRSRGVALALAAFPATGVFGGHRFYTGKVATGVCQALTLGGFGIWWLYDLIVITAGSFRDDEGKRVVNWMEDDAARDTRQEMSGEKVEVLLDEIDGLRAEMGELVERVDFMERMLAQARERRPIPPGSGSV
jgi:TM2 domain-containing membrane protein YozV